MARATVFDDGPLRPADGETPPNVADHLRTFRHRKGLSLEALAAQSGVSRAMLGQIEAGKSVPTITVVWKIARALGLRTADLISNANDVEPLVLTPERIASNDARESAFSNRSYWVPEAKLSYEFSELRVGPHHREHMPLRQSQSRATLLVVTGSLELQVDAELPALLQAGDAVLFHTDRPHSISNPGHIPAKGYLVLAPLCSGTPV